MSFILRKRLAQALLLGFISTAGYVNWLSEGKGIRESGLPSLAQIAVLSSSLRTFTHVIVFGLVAYLLGPHRDGGSKRLAWHYVLIGGVLTEIVQMIAGHRPVKVSILLASGLDIVVDIVGGFLGLWLIDRQQAGE